MLYNVLPTMLKALRNTNSVLFVFILICLTHGKAFSQEYGLEFLGHEVITDKRTSLVLGQEKPLCLKGNFELGFELKFKPDVKSYFGYVFRLITTDGKNLDLLFQSDPRGKQQTFRVISGDKDIRLLTPNSDLFYSHWHKFKVVVRNKGIQIFVNNQLLGKGSISNTLNNCFKVYFGECSDSKYLTSDALPMYLRNITLGVDSKIIHHWPLREISGNSTNDTFNVNQKAFTKNAQWLLKKHHEWKQLAKLKVKGNLSFAFDNKNRRIIINTDLRTFLFNTRNDSLTSKPFTQNHKKFTFGDLGIFLPTSNKLINVRLNEKKIFNYNALNNSWDISPNEKYELTEYWHHNKFLYPNDTAVVFIGGYGQYKYKNTFKKYSFQNNTWTELRLKGDTISPRYMFGLGSKNKTTSYLLGGFGSKTGDQGLSPQNYYDLFEIDWKNGSSKKIYELRKPETPFSVASSLILDEKSDKFYGLIYNQLKFNSNLQLVEGSLTKPELKPISKSIPYQFIDVASYSDLYFDKTNKKLYCVTSFHNRPPVDSTELVIYSLDFPPSNLPISNQNTQSLKAGNWMKIISGTSVFLLLAIISYYLFQKNRQNKHRTLSSKVSDLNYQIVKPNHALEKQVEEESFEASKAPKGKILLFGGFQFINDKETDLTNMFTPLLREMFLYILLHSVRWNKGVNSQQLNELLWFDKSVDSARNNRSVNITKLKTIFEQMPSIQINKDTGNWMISFEPEKVCLDYFEFLKLTNSKKTINHKQINQLTEIINRGGFLTNLEYEWLDDFKGEISNKVIDTYLAYSKQLDVDIHAEEMVEIADNIFKFDSVDETAMMMKCRALVQLGKHSLAKTSYEKFAKDYKRLYSEEYKVSYKKVLED
ncbi:response regulator receiver and SARP domain protein [Emticicia oligotrophica DSM 17448]|uniref:Response regulator receiver and SARP domain protein n=1 Tax=Emticicia oligotrophica (strain DSM 17448 / CIP 109782 / MTCC 6937 / GPTSA100-15) TaxID=929562 RepID=A0ABN4AEL6_EMTOG|nr:transcriptional regulator [Emticicia oligotrophica]AFK03185.1 response regulator receiver and SARP domain protein [Emticicia oligotrophica DSM 17448]